MTYAADLHLHSSYAIGTSPQLDMPLMVRWARIKGIDLIAASDFTHPVWLDRLKRVLVPADDGLYRLVPEYDGGTDEGVPRVILGTEVSCVYPQGGRSHRVHLLLFAPDFEAVHRLCDAFAPYGALPSDGRPMLKLSSRNVVAAALEADERCEVVPAHVWTPWYSVYGSKGGFESLEECFGDMTPYVKAIETGLSSDPSMNWRIPELDAMTIVSFSDAHSVQRMGRELTVFDGELSYEGFRQALREGTVDHTVEFYPEEGKYHYDGHRKCNVRQHPAVTLERGDRCPSCGRKLTIGVLNRMESMSDRPTGVTQRYDGMYADPTGRRPPFRRLVGLEQVIGEAMGKGPSTKSVQRVYAGLIEQVGSELYILESASPDAVASVAGDRVAEGVLRARRGDAVVEPGYDGVYGSVHIWPVQGGGSAGFTP